MSAIHANCTQCGRMTSVTWVLIKNKQVRVCAECASKAANVFIKNEVRK